MHHESHRLLDAAPHPLRLALLDVAARHRLTVDVVVQRAIGRDLPGAPPELVRAVDAAVVTFIPTLLSKALEDRVVLLVDGKSVPPTAAANASAEAKADYAAAIEATWTQARDLLATAWPAPQNYAPARPPPAVEVEAEVPAAASPAAA